MLYRDNNYYVMTSWARVVGFVDLAGILLYVCVQGDVDRWKEYGPYKKQADAIKDFSKIFKDKTGNKWENRNSFKTNTGKYTLLHMD